MIAMLLVFAVLAASSPPPTPPATESPDRAGDVAGTPLLWEHVAPWLPRDPAAASAGPEAIGVAVERAVRARLLALEARQQLGAAVRDLDDHQAGQRLLAAVFSSANVCTRPPSHQLAERYRETAWRFVAPPAWSVADVQLLCCRSPAECKQPDVAPCLDAQAEEAAALAAAAPRGGGSQALEVWAREQATDQPRLAFKRYTFYFAPGAANGRDAHWRLQTVDPEISAAVAPLRPGQLSEAVRTRFGHHLLLLESRRDAINLLPDDPRTEALLIAELCPSLMASARDRFARSLRSQITVELNSDTLRAWATRPPPPAP